MPSDETDADAGEEPEPTGSESEAAGPSTDGDAAESGDGDPESISNIDRIVLDADELVQTLAYNGQEDIGQKNKAVYVLAPPFGETARPTLRHLSEDSTEKKSDEEIHMRPFRFVVEGRAVIEQRPTRTLAMEQLGAEDPAEAAIEAWIDEAMTTWKDHVRDNLAESVDIFSPHGMAIVDVAFESDDDE